MIMYSTEFGVIKSGVLDLVYSDSKMSSLKANNSESSESLGDENRQKVIVVVYKTSLEHFAVVYPNWGLISAKRPFCIINLKRAKVLRSDKDPDHQFTLLSYRDSDVSTVLCFTDNIDDSTEGNQLEAIESWISALQSELNDFDSTARHVWKWSSKRRVSKSSLLSVLNEDDSEEYGI